ncbi:E3 ubiquitin-protein ligase TRIM7-like [Colossoma macropomum]|uniref:E3 ubiquitin-protein ligase TRIM7-like n=1 Tax=Colossoma macropomum TaxID=42526 RepID=UPI001863C690|nr:E3 ubiquitin-protein ligase TRIM7-like [Colossoma macropomum]
MYEEQLACVICQTSRKHRNHSFVPADEAAHDTRVDLKAALKILKEKLQDFKQAKETCDQEIQHIIALLVMEVCLLVCVVFGGCCPELEWAGGGWRSARLTLFDSVTFGLLILKQQQQQQQQQQCQ